MSYNCEIIKKYALNQVSMAPKSLRSIMPIDTN